MKLLLINLSLRPDHPKRIVPIGLGYIATAIHNAGIEFDLLDMDIDKIPMDKYYFMGFGLNRYDVIVFGCIITGYRYAKQLVEIIKELNPEATIIVGNSVANSIPIQQYLPIDFIVEGEGDKKIISTLKLIEKGHSYLSNEILDINELPFINWDLFNMEKYIKHHKYNVNEPYPIPFDKLRAMPVNSARGCVHKCSFCYQVFQNYPYRYRSVKSLSDELWQLMDKYSINYVTFYDDLTIFSKKRAEEFVEIMDGKGLYWTACCRSDLFTEKDYKLLERLKNAGCVSLGYSLESANKEILKAMNKHLTSEQFAEQKKVLDEIGIATINSLVIGYPQETEKTLKETFDFCYEHNTYPSTGYLQPLPMTPMYDYAIKHGHITNEEEYWLSMGDRQDLRINLTQIPSERLEELVHLYLRRIRNKLKLPLSDDQLIKTGVVRGK